MNLNRPGSRTRKRVEIALGDDGPTYSVGDSLGVYPDNCEILVEDVIAGLGRRGNEAVRLANGEETSLRIALPALLPERGPGNALLECLAEVATDRSEAARIKALIDDDAPIAGFDLLDVLAAFPSAKPLPEEFLATLRARSNQGFIPISELAETIIAGQVHLTVRSREHTNLMGAGTPGVASTMVRRSRRAGLDGQGFRSAVTRIHTAIRPRGRHDHDRTGNRHRPVPRFSFTNAMRSRASGKNWLFFGDQRAGDYDFLYQDELSDLLRRGSLTRLDTAFSRDQDRKVYVQDRVREHGSELYRWLESGAHLYVCGDAKRMAADVDRALREVVRDHGRLNDDDAKAYVGRLSAEKRYSRDVY